MSETNNSNEVVVSIKNLQKAFGDNVVLRDIDLMCTRVRSLWSWAPRARASRRCFAASTVWSIHEWLDCR